MTDRLDRLQAELEEPLLVSSLVNVRYLTGLASSNAALLVEPGGARLFTDFRYAELARAIPDVELVQTRRDIYAELPSLLDGRIAFEPSVLSYERYSLLAAGGLELVPRRGLVESMRAVKDDEELDAIRRAAAFTDHAYEQLAEERFVGRTERDLAWRMQSLLHDLGGEREAFDAIVASGPTGASPHSVPGERTIEVGETVIVDAGCRVGGYCSDCTRTFVTGELPPELQRAYEAVKQAQEIGLHEVRAGVNSAHVDQMARATIDYWGLGDYFGHGLGHGVGLDVHEAPWLNVEWPSVLAAGNVVTVEPGVYLPGLGGVRIEDLVIVTEDGPEVLTPFTKEPVTVG
jgi:Xaa-Pro aminopeptidase